MATSSARLLPVKGKPLADTVATGVAAARVEAAGVVAAGVVVVAGVVAGARFSQPVFTLTLVLLLLDELPEEELPPLVLPLVPELPELAFCRLEVLISVLLSQLTCVTLIEDPSTLLDDPGPVSLILESAEATPTARFRLTSATVSNFSVFLMTSTPIYIIVS
jgi:hypothetical protein